MADPREGDFWQELAGDLSAVSMELDAYRAASRKGGAAGGPAQDSNALESQRESEEEADLTTITEPVGACR